MKLNKQMIIPAINIIFTMLFLFLCFKLNMIPIKYIMIIFFVLIILNILVLYFIKKKKKVFKYIGIVISLFLILINIIGIYYFSETIGFLNNAFNKNKNIYTYTYYVVTKDEIDINKVDEISYYADTINIDDALNKLEEKINLEKNIYNNLSELFNDLDNDKIMAVLIEKSLYEFVIESSNIFNLKKYHITYSFNINVEEEIISEERNNDYFNIYIGGADFTELYNDFNMIVTVNKKTNKILLTSTPRDFYVEIAGKGGAKDLLGYAGVWGINTSKKTLENLYNINIDYYLKINTKSLVGLVDTLGGLEFCSDKSYKTTHATVLGTYDDTQGNKLYVKKGCYDYSGIEILTIARERLAFTDGDRQRQRNCQQIMINIFKKMVRLENLTNYSNILNAVSDLYTTNIPKELVTELAKLTLDGDSWSIEQQSVTGRDSRGYVHLSNVLDYVMLPNTDSVNQASMKIKMIESGK